MPEAGIILAQAVNYVACAPKSNASFTAYLRAGEKLRETGNLPIPAYLRDAHYNGHEELGRGTGYLFPHDYPGHYVPQQYLPDGIRDEVFYEPSDQGYEKHIGERLRSIRKKGTDEGGNG